MSTNLAEDEERLVRWSWARAWCTTVDDDDDDDDAADGAQASASRFGVEPCIRLDRAGYVFRHMNTIVK